VWTIGGRKGYLNGEELAERGADPRTIRRFCNKKSKKRDYWEMGLVLLRSQREGKKGRVVVLLRREFKNQVTPKKKKRG